MMEEGVPGRRVLVVDDSPTVRKLVDVILTRAGYEIRCAENGSAGLEVLGSSWRPDLILVDFIMPGMNGQVFCHQARALEGFEEIPIVLISAKSDSISYYFEEVLGVSHCLHKPFEPGELIRIVEELLPLTAETVTPQATAAEVPSDDVEVEVDAGVDDDVETVTKAEAEVDITAEPTPMPETPRMPKSSNTPEPSITDADQLAAVITDKVDRVVQKYFQAGLPQLMHQVMWNTLRESGLVENESLVLSSSLSFLGLADALNFANHAELSGTVRIMSDRALGEIYIDKGHFVFAKVSQLGEHEFLTDILLGQIEPGARRKAAKVVTAARQDNVLIGRRLVESGLLSEEQLEDAIQDHAQSAFSTILEIEEGHLCLESGDIPDYLNDVRRIPLMQVLMNGLRIMDEKKLAEQAFESENIVLMRMISNDDEEVHLTDDELEMFSIIDGHKTLREIIAISDFGVIEAKRVCHRLILTGLVRKQHHAPADSAVPVGDSGLP